MDRHCRCACVRPGQRRQPSISLSRKSSAHRGSSPARTQHRRSSGAGAARLCAVAASVTRCATLPHVAFCALHQGVVHVVHRVVGCMLQCGMRHVATLHVACCPRRRRSFFARPRLLEEGRVFCVPVAASLVHPEGRRRFIGGAMPASARSSQQDAGIGEVRGSVGCALYVYVCIYIYMYIYMYIYIYI